MTADHPLTPRPFRVAARRVETTDVVTVALEPVDGPVPGFRPGQFMMLTAFGVGEIAVSLSGTPGDGAPLEHTVRSVGAVSAALCRSRVGDLVGVRGPFGTDWGTDALVAGDPPPDVVVVAGGIGLAPLRGTIRLLAARPAPARLSVCVGARSPDQLVYPAEYDRWRDLGAQVEVTVDQAGPQWTGRLGVVTSLLGELAVDPARAAVLVCGPEVMMRLTARALVDAGFDPGAIAVSLERNMQCGLGWCGHCQLGPILVCRDGPVVRYDATVAALLAERER